MILLHKPIGTKISQENRDKILTFLSFERGGSFSYAKKQKKTQWLYSTHWITKETELDALLNEDTEAILLLNHYTDQAKEFEKVPIFKRGEENEWFLLFQAGSFNEISSGFSQNNGSGSYNNGYTGLHKLYDNFLKFLNSLEMRKIIDNFANKGDKFPQNGHFITIDSDGCHRHGDLWKEVDGVFFSSNLWKDTHGLSKEEREKKKLSISTTYSYTKRVAKKITHYNAKKSIVEEDECIKNVFLGLLFEEIPIEMKADYMPQSRLSNCYLVHTRLHSPILGELESDSERLAFDSITYYKNGEFGRYIADPKVFEINSIKSVVYNALREDHNVKINLVFRNLAKQNSLQEFEIILLPKGCPIIQPNKKSDLINKLKKMIKESTPKFKIENYNFDDATEGDLTALATSFGISI